MNTAYYADLVCSAMALTAIGSALLVVGQAVSNPVNAVLWLIVSFVAVACYLITAGMTFLGLSYVIVYVGAIAVLFLFVVMMLNLASQGLTADLSQVGLARNKMGPVAALILVTGALAVLPLSQHITLVVDLPVTVVDAINSVLYGTGVDTKAGYIFQGKCWGSAWVNPITFDLVSPMNQVQTLGLTLYTHGALWLMIISVLLMLAMLVPLALAFTA